MINSKEHLQSLLEAAFVAGAMRIPDTNWPAEAEHHATQTIKFLEVLHQNKETVEPVGWGVFSSSESFPCLLRGPFRVKASANAALEKIKEKAWVSPVYIGHPLPTSAAHDDNKMRTAVETAKQIIDNYFMDDDYDANGALRKVSELLDEVSS